MKITDYMLTKDVAETFGVTIRAVYMWIDEGKLHPQQIGRTYLFDPAEVEKFAEERRRNPRIQAREKGEK